MNVEFAVKKTFVGGKFEDVLKCITSTDMIFYYMLEKIKCQKVSMSNVNVRNAKSKMFETRTAKASPRPPT